MKLYLIFALSAFIAGGFSACSDDDDNPEPINLVGPETPSMEKPKLVPDRAPHVSANNGNDISGSGGKGLTISNGDLKVNSFAVVPHQTIPYPGDDLIINPPPKNNPLSRTCVDYGDGSCIGFDWQIYDNPPPPNTPLWRNCVDYENHPYQDARKDDACL